MPPDRKVTEFEKAVYDAARLIPAGKVSSYGAVSAKIKRGTARSVGTALSKNPFAPEVPCHRVVRADGSLGGFDGETSGQRMLDKEMMLRNEGVMFLENGKVAPGAFV